MKYEYKRDGYIKVETGCWIPWPKESKFKPCDGKAPTEKEFNDFILELEEKYSGAAPKESKFKPCDGKAPTEKEFNDFILELEEKYSGAAETAIFGYLGGRVHAKKINGAKKRRKDDLK